MPLHALAAASAIVFSLPAFSAERIDLSGLASAPTHDRFIVKYRNGSAERVDAARMNRSLAVAGAAESLSLKHLRRLAVGAEVVRSNRKLDRVQSEQLMRQIAADPNVEYVEVDRMLQVALTPNDPRYAEQWGYHDADAGIRANEAWDTATGAGIVVAVIDTGITGHSDLDDNLVAGYDFVSDAAAARDGNGRDGNPADEGDWFNDGECRRPRGAASSWHGTHVAGTVAALSRNGVGVAGTAFNARVQPVRVLAKCGGATSDIADAVTWASGGAVPGVPANATPAEVINLSLGGGGSCGATMQNAINGAVGAVLRL
jgi:serine protease